MKRFFVIPFLAVLLAACSTSGEHMDMHDAPANGAYSNTDIMFAEMMIPHHQQALEMSELAVTRSTDPDVLALASEIRAAQAPEIEQMRAWGATGEEHMGHTMQGMLTDDEMSALRDAQGSAFDRLFLKGMIAHHEGAIDMAQMILASKNDEVRALGENVVQSQTAEIERMRAMLNAMQP